MKTLTAGWLSVFVYIGLINIYIWSRYWQLPFENPRLIKLVPYIFIHLSLILASIYYFSLFFRGKNNGTRARTLSYISAFYLTIIHYSTLFYLIYNLFSIISNRVSYFNYLKLYEGRIFCDVFFIFSLAALISIRGIINSCNLLVKNYYLNLEKRDSKIKDINIVYLSDIHMGTSINRDNIHQLISRISHLKPDVLILGGDIFDEGTSKRDKKLLASNIGRIDTKYGIFAIEGNHEYKSGGGNIDEEMAYFLAEGIGVLRDDYIEIDSMFYLIGRKDPYEDRLELDEIVSNLKKDIPIILLDHRPSFKEAVNNGKINLQISGHSHNGQFFPMQLLDYLAPNLIKQYSYGHHKIENLDHIVSAGAGNWGIPVRLGSRREIVRIRVSFR